MGKQFENVLRMPGGMPRHLNIFQNALSIVTPERDPKRLLQGVGMLNLRGKAGNFRLFLWELDIVFRGRGSGKLVSRPGCLVGQEDTWRKTTGKVPVMQQTTRTG